MDYLENGVHSNATEGEYLKGKNRQVKKYYGTEFDN